jgi:hypothetical protein
MFLADCVRRTCRGGCSVVSLLMLAVVALFPVVLLALLLITSGLEGRVVGEPTSTVAAGEGPGPRE